VGQATRTSGDMKESHHGRLEMEEGHHGWIPLDGSRLEKLRVEHLKIIESVELVERWEVTPVSTDASLNDSDREQLRWKYRFFFLKHYRLSIHSHPR
jgi:hypothetical protein